MNLIDVDKLKQYIDDCECCEKCDTKFFKCYVGCELPDFLTSQWERVLNEQPTVDAEPVRHGRWIDETFESWGLVHHPFKCNLCGEHAEFSSPYCPECGAKMDL